VWFRQPGMGNDSPMEPMEQQIDRTAARIAHNEARFREANERIASSAAQVGSSNEDALPFLCECPRVTCTEIVRLTLPAYRDVREHVRRFFCISEHAQPADGEHIVDEQPGYAVVEKSGLSGELAERLA